MTDMAPNGHNGQLSSIVDRIVRLEEEKHGLSEDIRGVYVEAKGNGFDAKALRAIVKRRGQDASKLAEHEAILETYMAALGMLADTPPGVAAIERAFGRTGL